MEMKTHEVADMEDQETQEQEAAVWICAYDTAWGGGRRAR